MGFFDKLFGKKTPPSPADPRAVLEQFIADKLPKSYQSSPQYRQEIVPEGDGYAVHLTLDMTADGSDYADFKLQDYLDLSELEGSYILENCLNDPPVPARFELELLFDERGQRLLREFRAGMGGNG